MTIVEILFWLKNYKTGRKVTQTNNLSKKFWVKKLQNGPKSDKLSIEILFLDNLQNRPKSDKQSVEILFLDNFFAQLFAHFFHKFTILGTIFFCNFPHKIAQFFSLILRQFFPHFFTIFSTIIISPQVRF